MRPEDKINKLTQLITERTQKAYNNNSTFLPLIDYDEKGIIDAVYIYDRSIGTYENFHSEHSPLLLTIWYNEDANDYVVSFNNPQDFDYAFDTGCVSELKEVMISLRGELL